MASPDFSSSSSAGGGGKTTRVRYGHLTLPENSANVALPDYATISGSQTPLVGVLMELREVRRLSGGRLTIVAHAICRFRVERATAKAPYPRADVVLLPDEEEVGLTGLRRESGLPTSALPRHWRAEAARAAAAAASLTWAEAEMAAEDMMAAGEAATPADEAPEEEADVAPSRLSFGEDGDDAHFRNPANYDTVSVRGVAGSHTGNGIGFGGSRGGGGGGGGGGVDQARALSERLQRCRLVATTCLTAASSKLLRSHKRFDVCVVDEAGQVNQVS